MFNLNWVDITRILVYFAAMIAMGVAVMRRSSKSMGSFFLAGIASALAVPTCFPNSGLGSLAGFPIILAISALGCVAGSLLTESEDDTPAGAKA